MAKYCPSEQGELSKQQKKVDLARFAYTTIKVLIKKQRESFTKMVMEDKTGRILETENQFEVGFSFLIY
jgi:hypothetical protein